MNKWYKFSNSIAVVNTKNGEIAYFIDNKKSEEELNLYLAELQYFNRFQPKYEYSFDDYKTVTLAFNISSKCNLKCRYCFQKNREYETMSIEFIKHVIGEFLSRNMDKKNIFVDLSGSGEPLMELEKIIEVSRYCVQLKRETGVNIVTQFVCNGLLLSQQVSTLLQKEMILFGCSLDGTKENHDSNRIKADGRPTFDIISKNLLDIKTNDFVGTSMVISESFKDDISKCYLNMLRHSKTVSIKFKRCFSAQSFCQNYQVVIDGYQDFCDLIISKVQESNFEMLFAILNGDDVFGTLISRVFIGNKVFSRCDAGIGRLTYNTHGDLFPCVPAITNPELKFHNNKNNFLFELAKKSDYCGNCEARYYCGGECSIVKYYLGNNDLYLCKIKRKLFEFALKMKSEIIQMKNKQNEIIFDFIFEKENRWNFPLEINGENF